MIQDYGAIVAQVEQIQSKIAELSPTPPQPPTANGSTFEQHLNSAAGDSQSQVGTTNPILQTVSLGDRQIEIPQASLGALPTVPAPVNVIPYTKALSDYADIVSKCADENGLAPSLIHAVIQTESGGNPRAVSRAGAMGLMQLMPANVRESGISDPFDPEQNIHAGTKQLAGLMAKYHGNVDLALAAYNAGSGAVARYNGIPPYRETVNYVQKVKTAIKNIEAH